MVLIISRSIGGAFFLAATNFYQVTTRKSVHLSTFPLGAEFGGEEDTSVCTVLYF